MQRLCRLSIPASCPQALQDYCCFTAALVLLLYYRLMQRLCHLSTPASLPAGDLILLADDLILLAALLLL
jgi:hypothetical protein